MTDIEQLERDIIDYGGFPPLNKYIVQEAQRRLDLLKPKVVESVIAPLVTETIVSKPFKKINLKKRKK